jgi:hypothetical protein
MKNEQENEGGRKNINRENRYEFMFHPSSFRLHPFFDSVLVPAFLDQFKDFVGHFQCRGPGGRSFTFLLAGGVDTDSTRE